MLHPMLRVAPTCSCADSDSDQGQHDDCGVPLSIFFCLLSTVSSNDTQSLGCMTGLALGYGSVMTNYRYKSTRPDRHWALITMAEGTSPTLGIPETTSQKDE